MHIRFEQPKDVIKIRQVNLAAFDTDIEANLVDRLRKAGVSLVSLVAEEGDQLIGHILFSPVSLAGYGKLKLVGLAPMAVLPQWQRKGVGSQLIMHGLQACIEAGNDAAVVLGHPQYYPRFGFVPSLIFGIRSEYDVPPEVFMVKELRPGALKGVSGIVSYHPVFNTI